MRLSGFEITPVRDIQEYRSVGIRARHVATGLDLYHLFSDDEENLFSFIFKTPSKDNSGVAHILEHSVLSGSRSYPIKDPFLALMKGSMNTFLNAMTYPDKTVYPASSILEQDYFNLMSVYGDSVFFPLLRREIFMQEGIRFEKGEDGLPVPQGVVFNEMQGAYSNHDSIVAEWSYRTLFPDTPYRFDSGGEPESILGLSYEDFLAYHATYYHPSNCRIFLYGNIPTEKQLSFIEEKFLSSFSKLSIDSEIPVQPRWTSPRFSEFTAPLGGDEDDDTTTITLNWLTRSLDDPVGVLSMEVLSEILLGNSGSPLEKAIVDSGLGDDVSPVSGLESEVREMVFSVGLRGTDPSQREKFEKLVFSTLSGLASKGIPREIIEGAVRRVEFRNREIRGGYPFGLRLMGKALRGWLHGNDPENTLEFSKHMHTLKETLRERPRYFEELIKTVFIENNHRVSVVVRPDAGHENRQNELLREKLGGRENALSKDGLRAYREQLSSYRLFQETRTARKRCGPYPPSPSLMCRRKSIPSILRREDSGMYQSTGTTCTRTA
jgi:Zn-dependent M16 (insulinase) family peptidase